MKRFRSLILSASLLLAAVALGAWQTQQNFGGGLPAGLAFGSPTFTISSANNGNGTLALSGNTSGTATITAPAVAGTITNPLAVSNSLNLASGTVYGWNADTGFSRTAAGVVSVGNGSAGNTSGIIKPAALLSGGTAAGLTGTGACATFAGQLGGALAGQAQCTAGTAASTLTITPGTTAPNGWVCYVQDETTRANLFQQTSHNATTCTLTVTSVTQNDVFVFTAISY